MSSVTARDVLYMAATIWGEARGEPYQGKVAVGHVIMNRLHRPGWWSRQKNDGIPDDTIAAVCRDPYQFSCWNSIDPNSRKVRAIALNELPPLGDYDFRVCLRAALQVIDAVEDDPSEGATHYHVKGVFPTWARHIAPHKVIGNHLFYKDVP